jgi:ribose 5-phosphate isomerase A
MADRDVYKQQAAVAAVELVQSGMILGLGHGSTAKYAIDAVANKIKIGDLNDVVAIPCSKQTEADMKRLGIPVGDLNSFPRIDITIDGADEVDPDLNVIKGGGGAVLREKIVAQVSKRYVIIVDDEKLSPSLGTKFFIPLEILPFGWERQLDYITSIGGVPTLRKGSKGLPVLSDQGNYLLDCKFGPISDLEKLAKQLEGRSGILEHGLFLNLATDVIAAGPGGIQYQTAKR